MGEMGEYTQKKSFPSEKNGYEVDGSLMRQVPQGKEVLKRKIEQLIKNAVMYAFQTDLCY